MASKNYLTQQDKHDPEVKIHPVSHASIIPDAPSSLGVAQRKRVCQHRGQKPKPASVLAQTSLSTADPSRSREPVQPLETSAPPMYQQLNSTDLGEQIAQSLAHSPELEMIMPTLASVLQTAFQVDQCLLAIKTTYQLTAPQEAGDQFQTPSCFWYSSQGEMVLSPPEFSPAGIEVCEQVLTNPEIVAICDLQQNADKNQGYCQLTNSTSETKSESVPIRAVLGIPTQSQGHINGGIVVMRSQPYSWTDSDMEKLKAVSVQVASAISHVQLQQRLRELNQHQSLIAQLTKAIHTNLELNQILQLAIDGLAQTLQVDRALALMLKYTDIFPFTRLRQRTNRTGSGTEKTIPKAKVTVISAAQGTPDPPTPSENQGGDSSPQSWVNQSFWLSQSRLLQQAFMDAPKPLVIADHKDLLGVDRTTEASSLLNLEAMTAMLMAPLVGAGSTVPGNSTVLGFLVMQHSSPRPWQPDELQLVELVGSLLSTAIIQHQTLQQVHALVEERTAQLQRSLEVQAKLYEQTRKQIDQLRHLNQLKDEFLSTMSHELRTPLASMTLAIRMLRQPGLSPERRDKYLDILEQQCSQETNLINDLLTLQQLESKKTPIQLQKVDMKGIIRDLAQSFESQWEEKGLNLELVLPKRSLQLQTDPDSLNRILQELLNNAGKYSDPNTTIYLRAAYEVEGADPRIVLTIVNTGAGISSAELPYIFDKFRRGEGVTQQAIAGTGLGLALVKCLVEHLNGTIRVSSTPMSNDTDSLSATALPWETCFTLTLPQLLESANV